MTRNQGSARFRYASARNASRMTFTSAAVRRYSRGVLWSTSLEVCSSFSIKAWMSTSIVFLECGLPGVGARQPVAILPAFATGLARRFLQPLFRCETSSTFEINGLRRARTGRRAGVQRLPGPAAHRPGPLPCPRLHAPRGGGAYPTGLGLATRPVGPYARPLQWPLGPRRACRIKPY